MKQEITICDNCKDECKFYIEISEGFLRRANGKKNNAHLGYAQTAIKDNLFCSVECLSIYLDKKTEIDYERNDLYMPGEQVGLDSPSGKLGK